MAYRKRNHSIQHNYKRGTSFSIEQKPGETDAEYYKRLAKTADQRLVRLEKLSGEKGFENVNKYAYASAMQDLEMFGDSKRFNTKSPTDRRMFNEKIMAMRRFLNAPTSTKKGIIEVYEKRAETINKNYGTNFTWQELADYFAKGTSDKLAKDYGSQTALYAIGTIQKRGSEIIKGIKNNKSIKYNGPVTDAALEILRKTKYAPESVLGMSKETKNKLKKELQNLS